MRAWSGAGLRTRLTVDESLAELDARVAREDSDLNAYRQLYGLLAVAWREEGHGPGLIARFKQYRYIFLPTGPGFSFAASDDVVCSRRGAQSRAGPLRSSRSHWHSGTSSCGLGVAEHATPQFALETLREVAQTLRRR